MRRNINKALIICLVAVIIIITIKFALPLNNKVMRPNIAGPVISMKDVQLTGLIHKTKVWSLNASNVELAQNKSTIIITNITNGKIFNEGKPAFYISAGRAKYNLWSKNLQLSRNIKITGQDEQDITAENIFLTSNGILTNTGKVQFKSKLGKLSTDRMLVNIPKKELTMWNVDFSLNMESE